MYRLHGQDAVWLYRETVTAPMHTLKIFLVSVGAEQRLDFEIVKTATARLLHEVPMLRHRPVFVPFGLHHPVMVDDPEFDLQYHLNRAAVPAPGSMRELEEVIAQIDAYPLDRTRPLWQFWLIEGLANGQVAMVQKIHHTLADGMASVNFIERVWQSEYHDPSVETPEWRPEPIPGRGKLVLDALKEQLFKDIPKLPDLFRALYRNIVELRKMADPATSPNLKAQLGDMPKLRWNHALSSRRSFATAQLPLADLKTVKDKIGGTLNDMVLALVGTSLRNLLLENDELPDAPLLVTVPVSSERGNTGRTSGNSTAVTLTLLHVQVSDPLERYEAIRASTELGKQELEMIGRDAYGLVMHYTPAALRTWLCERDYHRQLANSEKYKIPSNLSVSNVPGPREKFTARGNVVEDIYSAGPLVEGMGLNITVWSYAGNMNFCLVGDMKALPDIHKIADGFEPALRELADCGRSAGGDSAPEAAA